MSKVQVELTGFQEGLMIVAGGGVGGAFICIYIRYQYSTSY